MIGQKFLLNSFDNMVKSACLPKFIILIGADGSGKKLIANHIANKSKLPLCEYGISVDSVRDLIRDVYKITTPLIYLLSGVDTMSVAAKNTLLKVTEEPAKMATIIVTATDLSGVPNTVRSRGQVFYMDPYEPDELVDFAKSKYDVTDEDEYIIRSVCNNPGDVLKLFSTADGAQGFYSFVTKVLDNIASVSGANALKISSSIRLKDTDENKYDLTLFWRAFMSVCANKLMSGEDPLKYQQAIQITTKSSQELRIKGINKQSAFDVWVLNIRKVWC